MLHGAVRLLLLLCAACSAGAQQDRLRPSLPAASAQPVPIIALRALSQDPKAIAKGRTVHNTSESVVADPSGREWLAQEPPILDTRHISGASLAPTQPDQTPFPGESLRLTLTPEAQGLILTASRQLLGQGMGVFIDGKLRVVATVRAELRTHTLEFTISSFSSEQLQDLVRRLNAR